MYQRQVRNPAPVLMQDQRITEIVFPLSRASHERGESAAVMMAQTWQLPIRLVNPCGGSSADELESWAHRLSCRYPLQHFTTNQAEGLDSDLPFAASLGEHSLVFMTTQSPYEWCIEGSTASEVLKSGTSPLLTMGPHSDLRTLDGEIIVALDALTEPDIALAIAKGLNEVHGNRICLAASESHERRGQSLERQVLELASERDACLIIASVNTRSDDRPIGTTTVELVSKAHQPVLTAPRKNS